MTEPIWYTLLDIADLLQLSRRQAQRIIKIPGFPARVKLGHKTVRWLAADVDRWLLARRQKETKPCRP